MISGIGCDILNLKHFEEIFNLFPSLLNKAFSPKEIKEYQRRNSDINFLASRFCAKEAIYKALKKYDFDFNTIEILNDSDQSPFAIFLNNCKYNVMVSISYEKEYVIAFATASIL